MNKLVIISAIILNPMIMIAQCDISLDEVTHINCFGDNSGALTVNITGNTSTSTYLWSGPSGFSSNVKNISNLLAGNYQLIVNDVTVPCTDTFNYTIQQPLEISAEFTVSGLCDVGDSADISTIVYGGTPPYTYSWSTGGVTTASIKGLVPGWYGLTITDLNNCISSQIPCPIILPSPLQCFMNIGDAECKDDNTGYIQAYISGGTSPYDFYWPNNIIDLDKENTSILSDLLEGTYYIEIVDAMGCSLQDTAIVIDNLKTCLEVYSAFSPNGDSNHDFWEIKNIEFYPKALIEVYNKSGDRVYRRRYYRNTLKDAFNGKINGKRLPSDVYYYIINLENGDEPFTGTVTIVR